MTSGDEIKGLISIQPTHEKPLSEIQFARYICSYVRISHLSTTDISFCVYNYLSLEIIVGIRLPKGQVYLTNSY